MFINKSALTDTDVFVSVEGQWQNDEEWYDDAPSWVVTTASGGDTKQSLTRYQDYFTIHGACMKILDIFIQNQIKSESLRSPRTIREFIDACIARQHESMALFDASWLLEPLPPHWATFQNVEHSHLYFGARRFWTDPWDCIPGFEQFCTDPIWEPNTEDFISTCLARVRSNEKCPSSSSSKQLRPLREEEQPSSRNPFTCFPREILDLIVSHLSLREEVSLCSSSPKLLHFLNNRFWRFHTLRLHGCWFWELRHYPTSCQTKNWKDLLHALTLNRFQIQKGAEPFWLAKSAIKNSDDRDINGTHSRTLVPPLPLGIWNRQRIWMCLEYIGTRAEWETKRIRHD